MAFLLRVGRLAPCSSALNVAHVGEIAPAQLLDGGRGQTVSLYSTRLWLIAQASTPLFWIPSGGYLYTC